MQPPLRSSRRRQHIQSTVNDIFEIIENSRRARLANMLNPSMENGMSSTEEAPLGQESMPKGNSLHDFKHADDQVESHPPSLNPEFGAVPTIVVAESSSREVYPFPLEVDEDEPSYGHSAFDVIPEIDEDDDMTMMEAEGGYQPSRQFGYKNYSARSSSDSRSVYPMTSRHSIRSSDVDTMLVK